MSNWEYATVVPTTVWRSANNYSPGIIIKDEDGHYFLTSKPITEFGDLRNATDTSNCKSSEFYR